MGAPTGSSDLEMVTAPPETGTLESLSENPANVMVAGALTERCLILAQASASGLQVLVTFCCGVNSSRSVIGPASGSSWPTCRGSPGTSMWIASAWSAKVTSTDQRFAFSPASRQRKVGGVISGGKIEPSSGYFIQAIVLRSLCLRCNPHKGG